MCAVSVFPSCHFFCSPHVYLPYLHSFPTRRSSDLLDLERLPSGKFATNDLILHLAQLAYNILRLMRQLGMTGELSPVRQDRKSTRLNSSHVAISYAVFCLKKKT